jgi:hypothetical protein
VQSDNQKNACDRTRERTAINPLSAVRVINPKIAAPAAPDEGTYLNPEKPGKAYLTIQPLSEMSTRLQLANSQISIGEHFAVQKDEVMDSHFFGRYPDLYVRCHANSFSD